jgi:hypothetical protein
MVDRKARIQLMGIGMLIGIGLPFLIIGMALHMTDTKMQVYIVSDR